MDYLVKHQYIDPQTANLKRKDLHLAQTLQEATLRHHVTKFAGLSNAISYNCVGASEVVFDEQFTSFKHFLLTECPQQYRIELQAVLYPLFCHIYLDLIIGSHKTPAHRFMSKHQGLFHGDPIKTAMVETLQLVFNVHDIFQKDSVRDFRDSKFVVPLSAGAFECLVRRFNSADQTALLHLLERRVDMIVEGEASPRSLKDAANAIEDLASVVKEIGVKESLGSSHLSFVPSSEEESSLTNLKKIISSVRDLPPAPPQVVVYQATGGLSSLPRLTSCDFSLEGKVLAFGCEDSSIEVCPTAPDRVFDNTDPVHCRRVRLHCDPDIKDNDEADLIHNQNLRIFRGHFDSVTDLAFFPEPTFFVSASEDKTLRLWHLEQNSNIAVYKGHNYQVLSVATPASPWTSSFVSGSFDRTCRLWSTDRTFPLRTLVGHNLAVESLAFHPNNCYFATGSADKTVRLWTINDGKFVRLFQGHRATICAVAFSPNGQLLASAGEDRRLRIWDIAQGTTLKELKGHTDVVNTLSFSADGSMLASGSQDGSIRVWDVSKGLSSTSSTNALPDHPSDLIVHHPSALKVHQNSPSSSPPSVVHQLCFGRGNTLHAVIAAPSITPSKS